MSDAILVGDSLPMRRLRETIRTIAPTRLPVLIEGATGTGKELIAALVHRLLQTLDLAILIVASFATAAAELSAVAMPPVFSCLSRWESIRPMNFKSRYAGRVLHGLPSGVG